jgi:hypothetical protein
LFRPTVSRDRHGFVAAAAVAAALACGGNPPAKVDVVPFENRAWGIKLEYPGEWEARAGRGVEPLILEARAPGAKETVGAGLSVVGAWSAAPLGVVASDFERKVAAAGDVWTSDAEIGGRPARAFEYYVTRGGERVWTRAVVVRGDERYYFVTFAAYEPQRETARPYFDDIERSIQIR